MWPWPDKAISMYGLFFENVTEISIDIMTGNVPIEHTIKLQVQVKLAYTL